MEKAERIRQLNDQFRRSGVGGDILITLGVQDLGMESVWAIVSEVRHFDDFNTKNDPYGEHDFGAFDHEEQRIFWKIDYYDPDTMSGSEDPSVAQVKHRMLTIMLASEY